MRALCAAGIAGAVACTALTGVSDLKETPRGGSSDACAPDATPGTDVRQSSPDGADAPDTIEDVLRAEHVERDGPGDIDSRPPPDAATGYAAAVLMDTPIAYWHLSESTGTIAHDSSGNGNNGTYTDCVLGAPGPLLNEVETSTAFDGTTSFVSAPNFPFTGLAPFSLEAWANLSPDAGVNYQDIVSDEIPAGSSRQGYALFITDTGELAAERFLNGSNYVAYGPTFATGQFHHAVATYDGMILTLYLDGIAVGTEADTRPILGTTDPLYIGSNETTKYFDGTIGEVAIYDHVLTATRVMAHFQASGR
jgi:hypothetical protein